MRWLVGMGIALALVAPAFAQMGLPAGIAQFFTPSGSSAPYTTCGIAVDLDSGMRISLGSGLAVNIGGEC